MNKMTYKTETIIKQEAEIKPNERTFYKMTAMCMWDKTAAIRDM